jgi:lyso-ornithine lipid O-acyltransferase
VNLRRCWHAVALAVALAMIVCRNWWMRLSGRMTFVRRSLWLQDASRQVLWCLGVDVQVQGSLPACGLVVANHLSYFDILILSAAMPCFFVAKREIEGWPYFGWAAREGGTIFLDRKSMRSARTVADEIAERLKLPVPVILFPEGTSTDGTQVLRFHSRLIDPATRTAAPITAAAIRYEIEGGTEESEVCFYGEASFLPHAWRVMGIKHITAQLRFGEPQIYSDRRAAAERTHSEVTALRETNELALQ